MWGAMHVENAMYADMNFCLLVYSLVVTILIRSFQITKKLNCQSVNLIYLMECKTCEQSCVGYTTTNVPKRLSNTKSHIKKGIKSCKLDNHFIDVDHSLDFTTANSFNRTLSAHLSVKVIDTVDLSLIISKVERERAMGTREGFYQTQLKTLERYGGINTMDNNYNMFKSSNINI